MEAAKILQSSALDIVFDNRNKMYGAYILRKTYLNGLSVAIAIMICMVFIFSLFVLHSSKKHFEKLQPYTTEVTFSNQPKEKPLEKKRIKILVIQKHEEPIKIKMTQFTKPVVTHDNQVTTYPPKQYDQITIGRVTQTGKDMNGLISAPPEIKSVGGNKFGIENNATSGIDKDGTFYNVQVEARFPGGEEAWRNYLHSNLRQDIPMDNGAPAGEYVVTVSFVVSKDGNISDVKTVDAPNPDYGPAAEAMRVIQHGPKWLPAIQNGRPVTYRQKQRIIFQIQNN